MAISAAVAAQPVMKISEQEHNFGTFKEEAGPQKFDFVVYKHRECSSGDTEYSCFMRMHNP